MENSDGNSNGIGIGIGKRPRSLDLKTIYESGRLLEKKSRKRKSGDGDVSVSKSTRKEKEVVLGGSATKGDICPSRDKSAVGASVEVSSGVVVHKASGPELVGDIESGKLDSFPLALNGAVLCIPKRKRSVRCGGSQELKLEGPSSAEVDNLDHTAKLNGDDLGTQKDTLKGSSKVGECANVQLKVEHNANEGDGGTDCLENIDGSEAEADSFKGLKKKGIDKSKGSGKKQLKSSQKAAEGEKNDCHGDASRPDFSKVHKKSLDKGIGCGNRHVKSSQKENEEESKPDCLENGNGSGSKTDSLKVHKKKGLDKVKKNRNRQMKSSQKAKEDGKVDHLANGDGSEVWTSSVKLGKKKRLDKVKESGNKKAKPSHSTDEDAGRTNRLEGGDCLGNQTDPSKIRRKKSLLKGKEIVNVQLNSSQSAEEEAGRTNCLVGGDCLRTQTDPLKNRRKKSLLKGKEIGNMQLNSSQTAEKEAGRADVSGATNAGSTVKKAQRKHGKAKGLPLDLKSVANKAGGVDGDNLIKASNEIDEDDEKNLEENAARMLSSRFDPSCTGFASCSKATPSPSKNRLSLLSTDRQFTQGSRSSPESESASVDAESMVLRPRSQDIKGLKRKRRHYYEMSSGNTDPFWILNRCIKVYWPLDESWYSGLVDNYDKERKLHHVKYVDRDEEWINLQNERFKLLLLPSEAPGKAERRRAAVKDIGDTKKVNVKTLKENEMEEPTKGGDSHGSNFRDSEPIISWLARSSHRAKTSSRHVTKKRKTNDLTPLSGEASGEALERDISNVSSGERPDELGKVKKCILDNKNISKDGKVPIVYFRRRFQKTCEVLSNASEGSSASIVAFEHITSLGSPNKSGNSEESAKNVGRANVPGTFRADIDAGMLKLTLTLPDSVVCRFASLSELLVPGYAFAAENYKLFYALMLYKYGTVINMNMWPRVHLEMLFVGNTRGLSFFLFQSCLKKALAVIHPVLTLFGQPSEECKYFDLGLPVTSIRFKFTCVQDHRKQIVFAIYNFSEVSFKKWSCLEYKLRRHCLLYGQLPLSECTFDNIKAIQNVRNGIAPVPINFANHSIQAEQGGSSVDLRRLTGQGGSEQFVMKIPENKVCLFSSKGGETKNLQALSGACIQVIPSRKPPGETSSERTVQIDGTSDQIVAVKKLVDEVVSEGLWRRSRRGLAIMGASRGCSSVSVGHISNLNEMCKKLPLFALSFTAAPTFFRGLHLKLLMEHSVLFIPFKNHDLMEHQENSGKVDLCPRMVFCRSKASDITTTEINLETMSKDVIHSTSVSCPEPELNALGFKSSHLLTAVNLLDAENFCSLTCPQTELKAVDSAVCGEGSPVKCSHFLNTADRVTPEASSSSQNPEKSGTDENVLTESKTCSQIELNKCLLPSMPSQTGSQFFLNSISIEIPAPDGADDNVLTESKTCCQIELNKSLVPSRSSHDVDESQTGSQSSPNSISIEIPASSQVGSSAIGKSHCVVQSIDCSRNTSVGVICSPNPTAPRSSSLYRNRSSSSFRYSSHGWSDSKADILPNGFGNRPKKPRTQVSYALPFGDTDFGSRSRSQRKGLLHRRIRRSSERRPSDVGAGSERNLDLLSCEANVLITDGDRGQRVYGALVVLELFDHNEWKLAVKVSGVTRYSYKAHQFLQPGSTNRYTHAMMWKGGKDWTLEFPDRSQWALFKEMHEECYSRNIRAAMVKNIPIPGVRLLDDNEDKGAEVSFVRSSSKYLCQEKTDVEMALDSFRILYDMDTDDEQWLKKQNASTRDGNTLGEISEELFEKIMDMFEKRAYAEQRDQFPSEEIQDFMIGLGPIEIVKAIYSHWQQKRQKKGMPLIRHFQPALWERYQQQLRDWEQAVYKSNYTFFNGHQEKSAAIEKPPMFAFCLKPRGLEVPNKGSKQRSQKKISVSAHNKILPGDQDGYHAFGRKSNGFTPGEEKITYHGHYFESLDDSPRACSPREASNARYFSSGGDGFDVVHSQNLNRSRLKKIGTVISPKDPRVASYGQRMIGMRNGIPQRKLPFSEWPHQQHYQPEGSQRYIAKMVDDSDLDELRRREAARRATSMARFKRERAQRLLCRADLLVHKAAVAVMTAEAIQAASESSVGDR